PRPRLGVAGFPWNQWQLCYGISGNFRVEQVAALAWNRWQASPGIGGSFRVEYAGGQKTRNSRCPWRPREGARNVCNTAIRRARSPLRPCESVTADVHG